MQDCAFWLPHELLETLARYGDKEVLLATDGLDPLALKHLRKCEAKAGDRLVPLGLWGDGVPVNWDRTESVECFSLNMPGQPSRYKSMRLPLTGISRKQIGPNTWDDILAVVAWSLQFCGSGAWPKVRHDNVPWLASDNNRKGKAGNSLGVRAALVESRGDWKYFGEVFHFPKHNTNAGCCWKCTCTPAQVRQS